MSDLKDWDLLRNKFVLLLQTGMPDLSFFAADCFHFSVRGYAEMAMSLWNNMVRGYNLDPYVFVVAVFTKDHETEEYARHKTDILTTECCSVLRFFSLCIA